MTVFVISKDGERLMPTTRLGKVRHMLKDGRAVIYQRRPFTIQLTYDTTTYTQPLELCVDAGYQHIGISLKSEGREYLAEQYDLLQFEKERHDDCRKYRRTRRNRKRYRKPRFDNRMASKKEGWLAPSLLNKAERHQDIVTMIAAAAPVADIYIEVGTFDTQVLQAVQEGKPIPEGLDYQHGPRYGTDTLREAVFQRDHHTCIICGRSIEDGAILHVHHLYFWRGQHGDRLNELGTVCDRCHTPKNHKEGGKLWGWDKELPRYTGAAFMNAVRWHLVDEAREILEGIAKVHVTYGAVTKRTRNDLGLEKSHCNDAYCMGQCRPRERAPQVTWQKRRRNNRILSKFYDAKYRDTRVKEEKAGGAYKSGSQLSSGRIKRNKEIGGENLRVYRGKKKSKGRMAVRKRRYPIQPGDVVIWYGKRYVTKGSHCGGARILIPVGEKQKSVSISQVQIHHHVSGWLQTA